MWLCFSMSHIQTSAHSLHHERKRKKPKEQCRIAACHFPTLADKQQAMLQQTLVLPLGHLTFCDSNQNTPHAAILQPNQNCCDAAEDVALDPVGFSTPSELPWFPNCFLQEDKAAGSGLANMLTSWVRAMFKGGGCSSPCAWQICGCITWLLRDG